MNLSEQSYKNLHKIDTQNFSIPNTKELIDVNQITVHVPLLFCIENPKIVIELSFMCYDYIEEKIQTHMGIRDSKTS